MSKLLMSKLLQHLLRQHKIPTVLVFGLLLVSQPILSEEIDIPNVIETLH